MAMVSSLIALVLLFIFFRLVLAIRTEQDAGSGFARPQKRYFNNDPNLPPPRNPEPPRATRDDEPPATPGA